MNAYLRNRSSADISLEYSLLALQGLDYRPAPWSAVDSLSWLKAMAWQLGSNIDEEVFRGPDDRPGRRRERAAELQPGYPFHDFAPIVDHGGVRNQKFDPDAAPGSADRRPSD